MDKDIVLIPGALATHKLWYQQELFFRKSKQFHHVDVLNSSSIEEMATRFISIAPKKFTLVGFSMGGHVALDLYRYIPEQIEKLILINTAAKLVSGQGKIERERSIDLMTKGKFDLLIKLIFKNSIYNKEKHSDLLPLVQEMALKVGATNYQKQLNAILMKPDQSSLLNLITCPTLLVASKQDNIMPVERAEHLAKNIKHSELLYLENCGHLAMLEEPDKINKLLSDWL
ncbi:MAG: alpha/beta hydrolase [Legionella sp.]|nr:alpha/beta hydrolase [Legionella sp.]